MAVTQPLIAFSKGAAMVVEKPLTPVGSALPILLFTIALLTASLAVAQYLDATEQIAIREIDTLYLTRLDLHQQGQYQEYRHHRVYPDPAARWVGEERELRELKQWIKQHDIAIQAALSREGATEAASVKNWLH
jgi:hypothetical protein